MKSIVKLRHDVLEKKRYEELRLKIPTNILAFGEIIKWVDYIKKQPDIVTNDIIKENVEFHYVGKYTNDKKSLGVIHNTKLLHTLGYLDRIGEGDFGQGEYRWIKS